MNICTALGPGTGAGFTPQAEGQSRTHAPRLGQAAGWALTRRPMTTDAAPLAQKLQAAIANQQPGVTVEDVKPLYGGACQDNYRVELTVQGKAQRMVLRSDALTSLPGSLSRAQEYLVIQAAVAAGVPTPKVHWPTTGLLRAGATAYFMDFVDGEAIARRVLRNPELADARGVLPEQLAGALAAIHRVPPTAVAVLQAPTQGQTPAQVALASLRDWTARLPEVHPATELGLAWLAQRAPTAPRVTLVHGDFRLGNFMVTPQGLSAVLDWEFARVGDPMEDLGWICVRDWRFGNNHLPAAGLSSRDALFDLYQKHSGHPVNRDAVLWWEVCGNLRWALGSVFQGERYLSGEDRNLELVAIARRAVEMEFEALRLMAQQGGW